MSAHGWPDGEVRPLPFGAVLAHLNNGTMPGSGQILLGELEAGAWPSLAFAITTGGVPVDVLITWEYVGAAATSPTYEFWHPGDNTVVLVPTGGHKALQVSLQAPVGQAISYAVTGSNRQRAQARNTPPVRLLTVAAPAAGAANVDVYEVPVGQQATIFGLSFTWFMPARSVPYPRSASQGPTIAGIDTVLRDPNNVAYWRCTLWTEGVPYTYPPGGPADPDAFLIVTAIGNGGGNNLFLFSQAEGLDTTLGEPSTALAKSIVAPLGLPSFIPAGHTLSMNMWQTDNSGENQLPGGVSDPRLQGARAAPHASDQVASIAIMIAEE